MSTRTASPQLGQNILVVMDSAPEFFDALNSVVASLPQITHTFFTLICCCPTRYWEHSGADNPDVRQEIEEAWKKEVKEVDLSEHCLKQVKAILEDAGVSASHIFTRVSAEEDSLTTAIIHELKQGQYSGVIVSRYHDDIVNRLQRGGITDVFRKIPKVEVCTLDLGM